MSTTALWHYHKEDRGYGPVQEADIRGLLARHEIAADTLVWREGLSNWTEAQCTELSSETKSPAIAIAIEPPSGRKHGNVAEMFNFVIFGIPLFVALAVAMWGL